MHLPMKGVRVLEVAQFWFVPSAGAVLADWGADVIKVEHPERGDGQRGLGTSGISTEIRGVDFLVQQPNRGKRASPDGKPEVSTCCIGSRSRATCS
jgi:crotonobetainyl-CoA:carnitine CoA-transferase CaiB-like acyl-CoA transferase